MKASRVKVYDAINSERNYQDTRWPKPAHSHSNTEYLVYIQTYVTEALQKVSHEYGDESTRDALRKIAALAVAAMEENGAEFRKPVPVDVPWAWGGPLPNLDSIGYSIKITTSNPVCTVCYGIGCEKCAAKV